MKRVRILVDSFADKGLLNAQMTNAREIIRRLDPELFNVSTFCVDEPDLDIAGPTQYQADQVAPQTADGHHLPRIYSWKA